MANFAWTREFENLSNEEILIIDRENERASRIINEMISYFWDQLLRFHSMANDLFLWSNDGQLRDKEREYFYSRFLIFRQFELRAQQEHNHTVALHFGELQWRENVADHLSFELDRRGLWRQQN